MRAYVRFRDERGVEAPAWVKDLPDGVTINQILGLATHLHGHSNAGVCEYGLLGFAGYAPQAGTLVAGADVHNKARCYFTYASPNGETKLMALWIPAPMMNNFEHIQGVGYRMTAAAGAILEGALRTLTGITDLLFSAGMLDYNEFEGSSRNGSAILYADSVGNKYWVKLPQPVSMAAMQTFNNSVLNNFTMCSCVKASYCVKEVVVVPDNDAIASLTDDDLGYDSCESRAILKFTFNEGTNRFGQSLTLPAMKSTILEVGTGSKGKKVQEVIGDGVALALTSVYGSGVRALAFKGSKVNVVNLKNQ